MLPWFNMQDQNTEELVRQIPDEVPILPLRNTVAFPYIVMPLAVGIPRSVRLIEEADKSGRIVGLVAMTDSSVEVPDSSQVHQVGTAAIIHRIMKSDDGTLTVFIQGLERFRVVEWTSEEPYLRARIEVSPDVVEESIVEEALRRNLLDIATRLAELIPQFPDEAIRFIQQLSDSRLLVYLIASNMRVEMAEAQQLLETDHLSKKMELLIRVLTHELDVREVGQQIQEKAKEEIERNQREYYLRQQLDAIRKELGEGDDGKQDVEDYRVKIEEAGLTDEAKEEAMRELARLEKMPPQAAEYWVIKTYLDWLTALPWHVTTEDNLELGNARDVLEEDHYDLEDVKERVLEFLAVRKLRHERGLDDDTSPDLQGRKVEGMGAILALVGPPGVGKTSLGQSIARALGREFTRMSLGGMRDEAEIRGHRRTYIGAMPGRIMQAIKRGGVKNPVFMLDEVDKIGSDWRGDPSSALLEVLDPQQNHAFRDHYLDVDFDLSKVLFICTGNTTATIPAPLLDRMEIINIDGYTEYDKVHIARQYLVPRQLRVNGLLEDEIEFSDDALRTFIRDYTREAGVRQLERTIGKACRKVATLVAEGKGTDEEGPVVVDPEKAREYLGKPRYHFEAALRTEKPGVATGLAWTPSGGEVLFVEAAMMPGSDEQLILTGQLGDVMRESARIGLSYVESHLEELGLGEREGRGKVHLHVPAGAVPKDGPSAGVTMVTALVSLLSGRPVDPCVAMTGEITLQGQVLPIGGLKLKALAAHRAGLKKVIVPKYNEIDIEEIPEEVREDIEFIPVEDILEVLQHALLPAPETDDEPAAAEAAAAEAASAEAAAAEAVDELEPAVA